jgi:hypothetical protein
MTTEEQKADSVFTDPAVLFDQIQDWQKQGCHVLTPATRVHAFPPNWAACASFVHLDPTVQYDNYGRGSDTYFDGGIMKRNEKNDELSDRGLSRIGIDKIVRAAGISWDPSFSRRVDTRMILNFWEYTAVGVGFDFDGRSFTIQGSKEVDLRDGSSQIGEFTPERWKEEQREATAARRKASINGWTDKRVLNARVHGLSMAETKAKERAARTLGLKQIYTVAELRKPFVCVKATYLPDLADSDVRLMIASNAMGGARALYAQQPQKPITVIDVTPAPTSVPALPPSTSLDRASGPAPAATPGSVATPSQHSVVQSSGAGESTPAPAPPSSDRLASDVSKTTGALSESKPGSDEPPPNAVKVTATKLLKSGNNRTGGWELWKVSFSNGQSFTTIDDRVTEDARGFEKSQAWVEYETKESEDGKYTNLAAVYPAGQNPGLFDEGFEDAEQLAGGRY